MAKKYKKKKKKIRSLTEPIWERQKNETVKTFNLFEFYCELGCARTLKQLTEIFQRPYNSLKTISSQWKWKKRANAYDEYKIQERRARHEASVNEVVDEEITEVRKHLKEYHKLFYQLVNDHKLTIRTKIYSHESLSKTYRNALEILFMFAAKPTEYTQSENLNTNNTTLDLVNSDGWDSTEELNELFKGIEELQN